MNRLGRWFFLTLLVVSLFAVPMMAQKTSGTIRGVVTDPSGAVVANVPVVVKSTTTGQERTVTTNTQGEYVAGDLNPGTYAVSVKAPNFKEATSSNVEVHTSDTTVFNVQLQVGSTSEQVTVAASEIQVQTDNAGLGEVVTGEQVRELPLNGRSFVQLTQLQPGVSAANSYDSKNKGLLSGVDFAVNGNSYTSNLFLIDGANNNDTGSNRTILLYPSIEAISEFKMLRNSYGAEYGMAAGAVINIVTKSGTNQWHGDVLYFGRNTALNAWDYFAAGAKAQDPNNPFLQKQVEQRNDYGFSSRRSDQERQAVRFLQPGMEQREARQHPQFLRSFGGRAERRLHQSKLRRAAAGKPGEVRLGEPCHSLQAQLNRSTAAHCWRRNSRYPTLPRRWRMATTGCCRRHRRSTGRNSTFASTTTSATRIP